MKPLAEDNNERLWQVDEFDQPIGSVKRKTAHDQNILHREVALLIYNEHNRVLFQKRSMKKRSMPGVWSTSVAGHIQYGKTADEEMVREAEEEVGLMGYELEYKEKKLTNVDNERYFKYWFETKVPASYKFKLNPQEVLEVRFLSSMDMEKMKQEDQPFNPDFVEYVQNFWRLHL